MSSSQPCGEVSSVASASFPRCCECRLSRYCGGRGVNSGAPHRCATDERPEMHANRYAAPTCNIVFVALTYFTRKPTIRFWQSLRLYSRFFRITEIKKYNVSVKQYQFSRFSRHWKSSSTFSLIFEFHPTGFLFFLYANSPWLGKHNQSRSDHITAHQLVPHTLTSLLENLGEVSEFITRRQHVKSLSCSVTPIRCGAVGSPLTEPSICANTRRAE